MSLKPNILICLKDHNYSIAGMAKQRMFKQYLLFFIERMLRLFSQVEFSNEMRLMQDIFVKEKHVFYKAFCQRTKGYLQFPVLLHCNLYGSFHFPFFITHNHHYISKFFKSMIKKINLTKVSLNMYVTVVKNLEVLGNIV